MKKHILSLFAAVTMCATADAQELSVADVEVLPGTTASLTLTVDVGEGTYSGFQFDIQFPTEGFSTTGNATASAAWQGGTIFVGDLTAGAGRVSALSTTGRQIPVGRMEIGTIEFSVDASVTLGNYEVTISAFNFLDGTSYTPVPDVTFTVHVVSAHTIVLDENATSAPEAAEGVNVRVLRTIGAGKWSTLCLPFAMSESQVGEAFGAGTELADFTGCEAEEDADGNIVGLKVSFADATAIEANHPYIIKVKNAVTEFTVSSVDIEPEEEPSVDRDEYRTGSGTRKDPYVNHYNSFVGTYAAQTVVPELALFLSDNQFWYSTGATQMKAFRAYFDFYDVLTDVEEGAASRITMSFDDVTTGVSALSSGHGETGNAPVYDLQGRRVVKPVKGLYVTDGKKVVIK